MVPPAGSFCRSILPERRANRRTRFHAGKGDSPRSWVPPVRKRPTAGEAMTRNSEDQGPDNDSRAAGAAPREVTAQASGGIRATVVVTVAHGAVLMSIVPPFTWEAIMAPETVEELIRALAQARIEATAIPRRAPSRRPDAEDDAR